MKIDIQQQTMASPQKTKTKKNKQNRKTQTNKTHEKKNNQIFNNKNKQINEMPPKQSHLLWWSNSHVTPVLA